MKVVQGPGGTIRCFVILLNSSIMSGTDAVRALHPAPHDNPSRLTDLIQMVWMRGGVAWPSTVSRCVPRSRGALTA